MKAVLCGLQFKWTAMLTVFMFLLAVVGDTLFRRSTEQLMLDQQIADALTRCDTLASSSSAYLLRDNRVGLSQIAEQFQTDPAVLYVEFLSPGGQRLSRYAQGSVQPPQVGTAGDALAIDVLVQHPVLRAPGSGPLYLDVARDVRMRSRQPDRDHVVGYVRAGFDLSQVQAKLSAFLQNVRYACILSIVVMIPLAFMVVRRLTAPLNDLSSIVSELAGGNFRVRAEIRRGDEIGHLATAFNTMADELSTSNDRLVKLNAELEDRVLQRTRQLKDLAARDPLTGLYNRRHFSEVLSRRFSEAERYGNDLACMMIDLDNFKKVNDKFGHETGDALLILTANVIASQLRGADVGARFGGDEFCVLLPQTSADRAQQVGERMVLEFQNEADKQLPKDRAGFGISVGVAGMRELSVVHPDELMKAADQALYQAKEEGKNRIHLAETLA